MTTSAGPASALGIRSGRSVLAVCDAGGRFVGAVPAGSLMSILRDEHVEDLHHMAGILSKSQAAKDALAASPLRQACYRLPWLLVGMAGSALATAMRAKSDARPMACVLQRLAIRAPRRPRRHRGWRG